MESNTCKWCTFIGRENNSIEDCDCNLKENVMYISPKVYEQLLEAENDEKS